jgi:hypothetical protein
VKLGIPQVGQDVAVWAQDIRRWLGRTWDTLSFKDSNAQATQDGILLWDTAGYPVVSKSGVWEQIALGTGGGGTTVTGGSATLAFGAAPGTNAVTVAVAGQAGIVAGSRVHVWLQGDSTADHNAYEHAAVLPLYLGLSVGDVVAATGFNIYATTELRLTGNVACRWEWT